MATLALVGVFLLFCENQPIEPSEIKSDERIIFFPTAAHLSDDGSSWVVPIHGWIFEPAAGGLLQKTLLSQFASASRISPELSASDIFQERAGSFLRDNEGGKRICIRIGERQITLEPSTPDGHFISTVSLPVAAAGSLAESGWIHFAAVLKAADTRRFDGKARLIERKGTSIVSDIDDTIKVTEVTDRVKLIENTFLLPFRPVEGMVKTYQEWEEAGAVFHYVSSSPWQLYEPLLQFTRTAGFPQATFHLKRVRLKDFSIFGLFANKKGPVIEELLARFPERRFILVGDSGESDPELYGDLGRKHPAQVEHILIREVTADVEDDRYHKAFAGLPEAKWSVFNDPAEVRLPLP